MKKRLWIIALALLLALTSNALAATAFKGFTMTFKDKDTYTSIVSDTVSKAKTTSDYATMIITKSSSTKNSKYYIYKGSSAISRDHFERYDYSVFSVGLNLATEIKGIL